MAEILSTAFAIVIIMILGSAVFTGLRFIFGK
jgi:hypothetical protein